MERWAGGVGSGVDYFNAMFIKIALTFQFTPSYDDRY